MSRCRWFGNPWAEPPEDPGQCRKRARYRVKMAGWLVASTFCGEHTDVHRATAQRTGRRVTVRPLTKKEAPHAQRSRRNRSRPA